MKKYLFIALLSLGLFWGSQAKAAESPIASTKATEALVDAFSFQSDGTLDMTITGSMTGVDLTLTGDLTVDTDTLFVDSTNNNVGIGTITPDDDLELEGDSPNIHLDSTSNVQIFIDRGAATSKAEIQFQTMNSPKWILGLTDSDNAGDGTEFFIGQSTGGADADFWIGTDGNVGIGSTTSPTGTATKVLWFGDNAGVPIMAASTAGIFGSDTATVMEMYAVDENGNESILSGNTEAYPKDMVVSSNFPHVHPNTQGFVGLRTFISEHRAIELLQDLLRNQGMLQANEYIIKHTNFTPQKNWEDNQEVQKERRDQQIQRIQDRFSKLDNQIADKMIEIDIETDLEKKLKLINERNALQAESVKIVVPGKFIKKNPGSQWLISKGIKLQ